MTETRPILLMTRPESSSRRFLDAIPAGALERFDVVLAPLVKIVPLEFPAGGPDPGDAAALVFTSRNGVETASRLAKSMRAKWPKRAYCLGAATTQAAKVAGWDAIQVGEDAAGLVATLKEIRPEPPLLHLHGRHVTGDVSARLSEGGIPTRGMAIYDQVAQGFRLEIRRALRSAPSVVPLFSARTARLFREQVYMDPDLREYGTYHACALSPVVANELNGLDLASCQTCPRPDAASMVALVERMSRELPGVRH